MVPAAPTLHDYVTGSAAARFLWDRAASVRVTDLLHGTSLGGRRSALAGRSVVIATSSQLTAALALIELDGVARRLTILPPDTSADHVGELIARAEAEVVVVDEATPANPAFDLLLRVVCTPILVSADNVGLPRVQTEWLLLTSGTSGVPKLVVHTHASLVAPIAAAKQSEVPPVWATFYDIRRYGGLQIFLRAMVGCTSLILSSAGEPIADHLTRLGRHGVTHVTGTPSHWRRALMSPEIHKIRPRYARLSGEIADQAVLDSLRAIFPAAGVGHAFASTEAGVAFEVNDGLAGFPASYLAEVRNGVEMKIADGALHIRSSRTASRFVGGNQPKLLDDGGFVDTGDMVELQGDRYIFAGRKGGIINVGGQKVHPEEIESVINRHPKVRMSLVRPRKNPVTGAVVIADVVLQGEGMWAGAEAAISDAILAHCRAALPRHKVPAAIKFVPSLDVAATGKLARRHDKGSHG
jgi:acyl-CoA synthetase (AMP-forming)/AMP-acid ligase II